MRIAISGAQGTGKSTIIKKLKEELPIGFSFTGSTTRETMDDGLHINELGTDATQMLIMSKHIRNFALYPNGIFDRCVLDGYVYTVHLYNEKKVSRDVFLLVNDIYTRLIKEYDAICYIPPEFEIINDGVRSIDRSFRDSVTKIFEQEIKYAKQRGFKCAWITGTIEERVKKIQIVIDSINTKKIAEDRYFNKLDEKLKQQIDILRNETNEKD